jgi:vitamin B12 transporter
VKKALSIATLPSLLLVSVSVFAELAEPVDQIIVTGARSPLSVSEVGSAVTIIGRDDIERRQARYVTDLLRAVPGFAVSHSGTTGSQTQVRVRGAEANHVLVLVDGIRANDPATGDEFRWEYLTTANIERIEIVRGPQSSLWGSDAVAAVVHIITRSAGQRPGIDAYLETGSSETLNGALSGSLGGERWALAASLEQLSTGGTNISRSGDEKDDSEITSASLSASFKPIDTLSVDVGARLVDAYSQFDAVDYSVTGLPTDSDVATDSKQRFVQLGTVIAPRDSRLTHRLNARYFDSDNRNLTDGLEGTSAASDRVTLVYQSDLVLGDNLLAFALEHEKTTFEQRGPVDFGDPNQDQEMHVTSLVADFQGRATDDLTWLLSTRYDNNSDFENSLTGRASLAWQLNGGLLVRASAGTAQKNPTFVERFGYFPGQFMGNAGLRPERSTSYDLGMEKSLLENALTLQLTVFEQDLEDEINGFVFDPVTFLTTAENMSESSERRGAEISLRWKISAQFDVSGNYTYTDSTDGSSDELRRPRHAGSLHADYQFFAEKARLSLAADYGGNRSDVFFPPWPQLPEVVTLSNYWIVDLGAQYEVSSGLRLFARASNLLDSDVEQVYGYRTPGRSVYAGIHLSF